ncbi:MAG: 2-hydroxyglutaryl-CoA dehydratase [Deltaproteobacteria bacterium]|nr:2-hydroxyglutaryl-CoA dehydratase [Deltaproteobacteria bacterium]
MSRAVGLDIGSSATKAVLVEDGRPVRAVVLASMPDMHDAAVRAVAEVGGDGAPVLTTGYGRLLYEPRCGDVSEITALAAGIEAVLPGTATVIDIGGQDSKAVRVRAGRVADFAMNDRCAAGTGRFLEAMSRVLNVPLPEFDSVLASSPAAVPLSSTCTVFAETEVVGLLSRKTPVGSVLAGLFASVAGRVAGLARQVGPAAPIAATGGTMRCRSMVAALSAALGAPLVVPPDPQVVTALGAAILCERRSRA